MLVVAEDDSVHYYCCCDVGYGEEFGGVVGVGVVVGVPWEVGACRVAAGNDVWVLLVC